MALYFFLWIFCFMLSDKPFNNKLLDNRSAKVDSLFNQYCKPDLPGASVMVIDHGSILYKKSFGLSDLENKTQSSSATNYRLASVTKQFTAMAIMMLIEQKRLSYESRLTDIFSDFPSYGSQITVSNLLSHTSGLQDYEDLIPEETKVPLRDKQVLDLLKQQTATLFTPGSKFRYSNSGYALLAMIVEKISGISFAEFLKKNIFLPLKMDNTVAFENGLSTVSSRAYGYALQQQSGRYEKKDQSLTSSVLGDGGIYSSVEDLYKWDQALYTDKLVSFETLKRAFTPVIAADQENISYGFGWFIETYRGLKSVWHYGSTVGFGTAIERFPERSFTVIVLINRDNSDAHEMARKVADIYLFNNNKEIR